MTKEFSNKTTFASVDLRKASTVKTNRSSELYAGDLAIANAIILGVFAHEKANKANREKLRQNAKAALDKTRKQLKLLRRNLAKLEWLRL